MGRPRIILLGDSITQMSFSTPNGFGAHISDVYQRRVDVYNRGYSGYNTNWILELIQTEEGKIDTFGPPAASTTSSIDKLGTPPNNAVRLVVIFLGANDASCSKLNARQHVPLATYTSNLKKIFEIAKKHCPYSKFMFVTPPPIHHKARIEFQIQRYGKEKATGDLERTLQLSGQYADAVVQVGVELSIPVLNVWKDMQSEAPEPLWHEFLSDGLHLSPSGNEFIGKHMISLINKEYPELAVHPCKITGLYGNSGSDCTGMKQIGPWHDEIADPKEYVQVFAKRRKIGEEAEKSCDAT